MKNRKMFLIPAIGPILLLIPILISFKKDYNVYTDGNIVKVKIVDLPDGIFTKSRPMHFKLNGFIYSKSIGMSLRNTLQIGEEIELKYLQGNSHFLFPNENPLGTGFFTIGIFILFSIASFYYLFKK
jgi:hypothetical protein